MRLYHYSNADIKEKLKVSYFSANFYTNNDKNISDIKRLFFYTKPEPEHLLSGCKYCYVVNYPAFRLYDITLDKLGFLKNNTIHEALKKIKQKYNGIIYKIGNNEIVNIFYDVKIFKKVV